MTINITILINAELIQIKHIFFFRILLFRLTNLIESLRVNHDTGVLADRAPAGPTAHIHSGILQVRVSKFCQS